MSMLSIQERSDDRNRKRRIEQIGTMIDQYARRRDITSLEYRVLAEALRAHGPVTWRGELWRWSRGEQAIVCHRARPALQASEEAGPAPSRIGRLRERRR